MENSKTVKKGAEIELLIETLAFGGKGLARVDNFVIFVERSLPGQRVRARIHKKKSNYAEARVLEILEDSPLAVTPRCSHFGLHGCGGCLWQNLDYSAQLDFKRQQVIESLEHIGGFQNLKVKDTLPSLDIYFYRNKMEFSFSDRPWVPHKKEDTMGSPGQDLALGLHVAGRFDRILDIENCYLLSEISNLILKEVRQFAWQSGWKPYTTRDHSGFWRFLVLREGKNTGEIMVNVVTAGEPSGYPVVEKMADKLLEKFSAITTIIHNINKKKAQIAFGDEEHILYGPGFITEKIGPFRFQISANSFFQTNTHQAERLYAKIVELAQFQPDDIVYDLYSGTGTISLYISHLVKKVIGFELVPEAVRDAQRNCHLNQVENCQFVLGDLKETLSAPENLMILYGRPDVVVVDPPRAGMHPKMPEQLLHLSPSRIICVSCNPATLARDLKALCQDGRYKIEIIQPVDMFPHTAHCEVVALLSKSGK